VESKGRRRRVSLRRLLFNGPEPTMRIIAGDKRRARLVAPAGRRTRPTLARVREALFMILAPRLPGARVLDLFAGTGALGLEALSRGAAELVCLESSRRACLTLRANARRLGLSDRANVIQADALRFLRREAPGGGFDLILADPPYGRGLAARAAAAVAERPGHWLLPGGALVLLTGRREEVEATEGPLARPFSRRYGDTQVHVFEVRASETAADPAAETAKP